MIQPDTPLKKPHFIIMFQQIDGHMIHETALKADGTIRPSGLDTAAWKHLCSSFSSFSSDVCDAMVSITRRICSSYEDASGLTVITACRLIAIDKCPGVRPIGVGETAHCIISRAILTNFVQDRRQDARKPSLTGQNAFSDAECKRMVLPVCLGGLGITNPTTQTGHQHSTSQKITAPLAALTLQQTLTSPTKIKSFKRKAKSEAHTICQEQDSTECIWVNEQTPQQLILKVSSEKGTSSWLFTLPITEHGFALHREPFGMLCAPGMADAIKPAHQLCMWKAFSVEHALSCACSSLPSIPHNELHDITAECLTEVCHNVGTEPALQSMSQEQLKHKTANREDRWCTSWCCCRELLGTR